MRKNKISVKKAKLKAKAQPTGKKAVKKIIDKVMSLKPLNLKETKPGKTAKKKTVTKIKPAAKQETRLARQKKTVRKAYPRLGSLSELKTLFNKQPPAEMKAEEVTGQRIEESKFYISPEPVQMQPEQDKFAELPSGYGDNRIIVQVRDPYWLHTYWEIRKDKLDSVRQELGHALDHAKRILRIYEIKSGRAGETKMRKLFDIEINDVADNWYINVGRPDKTYCIDIGLLLVDGRFITLARSNIVHTPLDGPSSITDEEWMIVEEDFNRLYGLSAGLGIGLSSLDIRKQMKQRMLNQGGSGGLSSTG